MARRLVYSELCTAPAPRWWGSGRRGGALGRRGRNVGAVKVVHEATIFTMDTQEEMG